MKPAPPVTNALMDAMGRLYTVLRAPGSVPGDSLGLHGVGSESFRRDTEARCTKGFPTAYGMACGGRFEIAARSRCRVGFARGHNSSVAADLPRDTVAVRWSHEVRETTPVSERAMLYGVERRAGMCVRSSAAARRTSRGAAAWDSRTSSARLASAMRPIRSSART